MTTDEALAAVRGYGSVWRFTLTAHARTRMRERGVSAADIAHALSNAHACTAQPQDKWKVTSADVDGDALILIVAIEDGVVVVTVHGD